MAGVGSGLFPPGWLAKLWFLGYMALFSLFHFIGRLEIIRKLLQVSEYSTLVKAYANRATFLTIYIREAHPMDGEWPDDEAHTTTMHRKLSDRIEAAQLLQESGLSGHLVVDSLDDCACTEYGALPELICLISDDGILRYMGGPGPWGYSLSELETALKGIL